MRQILKYLTDNKSVLNFGGIADKIGADRANFSRYASGEKPMPDKYIIPLLDTIIALGGGVWNIGRGWHIEKSDDYTYLTWCIAEEFETIDCDNYFKYPVKFKSANLSRDIITDLTEFKEFLNSIADAD